MTFLTNPPRKAAAKRARKGAPGRAAQRRQSKRKPPKGFATWAAYMASIRPKSQRAASSAPKGESMAKKKGKKRHAARSGAARRNPARSSRRRSSTRRRTAKRRSYRRNPPALVSRVVPFAIDATRTAAGVLAGKVAARKVRGMIGQKAGTVLGSIAEAGVGLAAGLALMLAGHELDGVNVAAGGILAVGETIVQQAGIPHVSDALSDDAFMYGLNRAALVAAPGQGAGSVPAIAAPASLNGPSVSRSIARGTGAGVMVG